MPVPKKKAAKSKAKVKVKDLKARKNPRGGTTYNLTQANRTSEIGLLIPAVQKIRD